MKILIIDRDRTAALALQNKLAEDGHHIVIEPVRRQAIELLSQESFDCIFVDPAPLPTAREITLQLRWEQRERYQYLVLMGHNPDPQEVMRAGLNAILSKPIDVNTVHQVVENAERLLQFAHKLQMEPELPPLNERMFGRRAMAELILSALDRTYRYGEQAFLLKINLINAEALTQLHGEEEIARLRRNFMNYIGTMRRMSDLLGYTDSDECTLLMQRPWQPNEPHDATERFAVALNEFRDDPENNAQKAEFLLSLWELPSASVVMEVGLSS
jgi:CheY-like chemotaxis protein